MSGKVALVTGGAQRVGAAIVSALAEAGYKTIIHCRQSRREAERLCASIQAQGGAAAIVSGDLADAAGIQALFENACAPFGPPRLLVNNASIFLKDSLETLSPASLRTNLAVNAEAPILLAQAFAARLPAACRGAIVHILDQRVLRPNPQFFSYSLAKAMLAWSTKTLAQALAPRIRVNAVAPGPTLPNVHDGETGFAKEAAGTLLGEAVRPADIAAAVLFLAEAERVTGQCIAVDSGQHLGWLTPDIVI